MSHSLRKSNNLANERLIKAVLENNIYQNQNEPIKVSMLDFDLSSNTGNAKNSHSVNTKKNSFVGTSNNNIKRGSKKMSDIDNNKDSANDKDINQENQVNLDNLVIEKKEPKNKSFYDNLVDEKIKHEKRLEILKNKKRNEENISYQEKPKINKISDKIAKILDKKPIHHRVDEVLNTKTNKLSKIKQDQDEKKQEEEKLQKKPSNNLSKV